MVDNDINNDDDDDDGGGGGGDGKNKDPDKDDDASQISNPSHVVKFNRRGTVNTDEWFNTVHSSNVLPLNFESARRHTTRITEPPLNLLSNYKMKGDSPMSTNYHATWGQNNQALQKLLREMLSALQYVFTQRYARSKRTLEKTANSAQVLRAIDILEDFVDRLLERIDSCDLSLDVLWDDSSSASSSPSWYTFGVMLNVFFGHYLLLENAKQRKRVCTFLRNYLPEPNRVTSSRRVRHFESCLLGPWLLRHHFDSSLDAALASNAYKLSRATLFPRVEECANVDGLHIDLSYYAYTTAVAFNYVQELVGPRSRMVYYLDNSLAGQSTYLDAYNAVTDMICHPSIKFGNVGVFGRRATDECEYKTRAPIGIYALPCASILVYKTKGSHFTVRGQRPDVAFYVADRVNYKYARYWVQMRQRYTINSKVTALSNGVPVAGMICIKGKDALVDLAPAADERLRLSVPMNAFSGVFVWENIGVMFQRYEIKEFGGYVADELVVVDSALNHIKVLLSVKNVATDTALEYHGENGLCAVIEPGQTKSFRSLLYEDRSNECVTVEETLNIETTQIIGYTSGTNPLVVTIDRVDDTFILFVDGIPKIALPPKTEEAQQTITYKSKKTTIHFDEQHNQWLFVE